jgi:hypothetical protein
LVLLDADFKRDGGHGVAFFAGQQLRKNLLPSLIYRIQSTEMLILASGPMKGERKDGKGKWTAQLTGKT